MLRKNIVLSLAFQQQYSVKLDMRQIRFLPPGRRRRAHVDAPHFPPCCTHAMHHACGPVASRSQHLGSFVPSGRVVPERSAIL